MRQVVAIHQPNFFPWMGYFDKLRRASLFVFMDNVAYPKSGNGAGSWCNRVKLSIQEHPAWVGCPIRREPGVQLIKDVRIDDAQPWRKKMLRTLEMNYRRTSGYAQTMPWLEPLIGFETDHLAELNINAITTITRFLGIQTPVIRQSSLATQETATTLLIEIVRQTGGNAYLCGGGTGGYQEDKLFAQHKVELIYQNFAPLPYGQSSNFMPGLSIIDFLMKANAEDYARLGYQPASLMIPAR